MDQIYYQVGHPAAYGSIEKLRRSVQKPRREVMDFLQRSDTYTRYKPARRRFPRLKTIALFKNELFQSDLADFQKLARYNKGYRYVLVCIDTLSKFVFYVPVKSKMAKDVKPAFVKIFKVSKPKLLQTDRGTEFVSSPMKRFFEQQNIKLYHTFSENKASLAERQIRTLRATLARIFAYSGKKQYYHLLPKLADAYNATVHTTTGFAPNQVNATNEALIFEKLYGGERRTSEKPKFKVGDQVRISLATGFLAKSSEQAFSDEIFTIKRIKITDPITYFLEDGAQINILGAFYSQELSRVKKGVDEFWEVERIIKSRTKNGKREYFVKFRGYENNHNTWVHELKRK
jgi:hypothetical protein